MDMAHTHLIYQKTEVCVVNLLAAIFWRLKDQVNETQVSKTVFSHVRKEFLADVELRQWDSISLFSDSNEIWEFWKNQFLTYNDKHAPIKTKRIGNKTWLHTRACKYNLSTLGTYFECEGVKCTWS